MKIRGYLSKERFSMRQVAGLLTVVFTGIAVLSYAAVSIPYTFTAGTTAKASEVNANFQTLANALPAAKAAFLNEKVITSTTGEQVTSLQVTLPASGQVIVNATGNICIYGHAQGNWDNVVFKLSKTSGDLNFSSSLQYGLGFNIPSTEPSYPTTAPDDDVCKPFSINYVFTESTAGAITYYLNAARNAGTSTANSLVKAVSFTALYVPNTLQ